MTQTEPSSFYVMLVVEHVLVSANSANENHINHELMLCPRRDVHDCAAVICDGKPLSDGGCTHARRRNIGDGDSSRGVSRPLVAVIQRDRPVYRESVYDRQAWCHVVISSYDSAIHSYF